MTSTKNDAYAAFIVGILTRSLEVANKDLSGVSLDLYRYFEKGAKLIPADPADPSRVDLLLALDEIEANLEALRVLFPRAS